MLRLLFALVLVCGGSVSIAEPVAVRTAPGAIGGNDTSDSPSVSPNLNGSPDPRAPEGRPFGVALRQERRSVVSVCPEIGLAAAAHKLPTGFLTRLIWQESRFDPDVVSRAGAQGIAQFMPATARWRGLVDPFDPVWALRESARWLSELRGQFGNLGLAAAAYNAGPKRVQDWLAGKRALPQETQAYVRIVTGQAAEEWGRPGVRDDNFVLPTPFDCQIKESFGRVVARPIRLKLPLPDLRRPGARRELAQTVPAWSLQLVGDRSELKAMADFKNLQKKFPRLLGTRAPLVMKRQLGGRSPIFWYQVRVAEVSRERANALCWQLRSAGGQCLVLSN